MVKTYPLESISLEQAMEKQFRLVDTACRFFTGTEILSLGDLGVAPGLNKPHTTLKVEQTLSAFFGTEKTVLVRGAGTGAIRFALQVACVPGQQVLVHDAPLYPTTESTFRMMGLQEVRADFNDADALEKVLAEHPQVQTALVQLARQKIDDRYDFTQVVARLKEHGLTVITDDNYAVMKLPRIGCEAGSDVSCFSTFKLLGPEGIGVVTGKADLVDRIIAMHYSGGMQVQGHEALAVLRGLVYAPVALAIQARQVEECVRRLNAYLERIEEAKRRDHRKLGKELGLFMMTEEGPGFPFFLPKGMVLKNTLLDYWRQCHKRYGYVEISTPMILNRALWERSGHWEHYKQNMYTTVIDGEDYAIKPMNCPGGMLVYKAEPHSYRDLPLRVGELGLVHRHELSGALHGLFRVRCFTQDDAHIFMTWEQMKDEIKNVVRLFDEVYSVFGLRYEIEVSTMPEDHMGDVKDWDFATETLKAAVTEMGKSYVINEGDGAFYGPKLDFHLADSLGRTWQCGTIQLDMQLPERFELEYTGADGEKHRPVMIHRVVLGSIERFIGIITEHYAGAFPVWLAPVQVRVLTITDRANEAAEKVAAALDAAGLRVEKDLRNEKIPYLLILGDKEAESGTVAVRSRGGDEGVMALDDFIARVNEEVRAKKN